MYVESQPMFDKLKAKIEFIIDEKNELINNCPDFIKGMHYSTSVELETNKVNEFKELLITHTRYSTLKPALDNLLMSELFEQIEKGYADEFFNDSYDNFQLMSEAEIAAFENQTESY